MYFVIFFILLKLYWSVIHLQWCDTFCYTTKWFSHTYTPPSLSFNENTHLTSSPGECNIAFCSCLSREYQGRVIYIWSHLWTLILIPSGRNRGLKWGFSFILYIYTQYDFWVWGKSDQLYDWSFWSYWKMHTGKIIFYVVSIRALASVYHWCISISGEVSGQSQDPIIYRRSGDFPFLKVGLSS